MNHREKKMVGLLQDLRAHHHVVGVKAEFEAEGTRMEEAMRLKEVSLAAGLSLAIKVGGCEAIKDMFEAACLGAKTIIAPMVETRYALKKYLAAIDMAFTPEQQEDTEFFINIETITAVEQFDEMLTLPDVKKLTGVVIGRVDLTGSMNLERSEVNGSVILDLSRNVASKAKALGLMVVVGGAVSYESQSFFNAFPSGSLDRFETRKVVFGCPGALQNDRAGFLRAIEFELLWLQNKKEYYSLIQGEDDARLAMLESRYRSSLEQLTAERVL